jgi:hypothetical protein
MTKFTIFYLQEHVELSVYGNDNQIIILYDETDGNFYYYGTRNRDIQNKYIYYSGKYHYTRLQELVQFIEFLFDCFISRITTELHEIKIQPAEYDDLNFIKLKKLLSDKTELYAYDNMEQTFDSMYTYLQTLITHEV